MNPSEMAEASPVHDALDGFATAVDHLVKVVDDGAVDDLDAVGLSGSCRSSRWSATGCRWWIIG